MLKKMLTLYFIRACFPDRYQSLIVQISWLQFFAGGQKMERGFLAKPLSRR